jgi:hypothetical protein
MHNDERIKKINLPMMFIIGLADKETGPKQMEILYNNAEVSAVFRDKYEIPGCDHYLTWYYGGAEYDVRLTNFINKAMNITDDIDTKATFVSVKEIVYQTGFGIQKWFKDMF